MNKIEILLTPYQWLTIPHLVRLKIAKDFKLSKSSGSLVTTQHGTTTIESDGHTVDDLRGINVISMQEYLGFEKPDPSAEFFALLHMVVEKAEKSLNPDEMIEQSCPVCGAKWSAHETLPCPVCPVVIDGFITVGDKEKFCDSCDSKGVKHKKVCPKNPKKL